MFGVIRGYPDFQKLPGMLCESRKAVPESSYHSYILILTVPKRLPMLRMPVFLAREGARECNRLTGTSVTGRGSIIAGVYTNVESQFSFQFPCSGNCTGSTGVHSAWALASRVLTLLGSGLFFFSLGFRVWRKWT